MDLQLPLSVMAWAPNLDENMTCFSSMAFWVQQNTKASKLEVCLNSVPEHTWRFLTTSASISSTHSRNGNKDNHSCPPLCNWNPQMPPHHCASSPLQTQRNGDRGTSCRSTGWAPSSPEQLCLKQRSKGTTDGPWGTATNKGLFLTFHFLNISFDKLNSSKTCLNKKYMWTYCRYELSSF